MNEKLQESLATILDKTVAGVEQGVAFLSAELPDVIHQLLMWNAIKSGFFFALWLTLTCIALVLVKRSIGGAEKARQAYKNGEAWTQFNPDSGSGITSQAYDFKASGLEPFLWSILACLSLMCAIASTDWLKIWIAPKLYLIEYAASLAK